MATVYAVTHTRFGKRAALKLAHPSIIGEHFPFDAFLREARIVHTVEHPGLPDVFATGRCDGRPYLVMERLTGRTLAELNPGRADALEILRELCEILDASHARGVVHRDLKLANVFVLDAPYGNSRRVKLIDWGVAHVDGDPDPLTGMIAGTLTYVAPEQIRGDALTAKTDVYSLGVLAFELLAGGAPFTASDDIELLRKHLRDPVPDPRARWPQIPEPLAVTLVAMLAKDPADRPSLTDVAAVLVASRPKPPPPPPTPRLARGTEPQPVVEPKPEAPAQLPWLARIEPRWLALFAVLICGVLALSAF